MTGQYGLILAITKGDDGHDGLVFGDAVLERKVEGAAAYQVAQKLHQAHARLGRDAVRLPPMSSCTAASFSGVIAT